MHLSPQVNPSYNTASEKIKHLVWPNSKMAHLKTIQMQKFDLLTLNGNRVTQWETSKCPLVNGWK